MNKSTGTICITDDNKSILKTLDILLSDYFTNIITVTNPSQLPTLLHEKKIDVVLLDMNFTAGINNGNEGIFWLSRIKEESPGTQVVLFTAYAYIDLAVVGIKAGAFDFITKPWDNEKLIDTLTKALNFNKAKNKKLSSRDKNIKQQETENIFISNSQSMKNLYEQIEKIASTDANVLLTGENGTGKEVFAKQIHKLSNRKNNEMISVDMGAVTETLFESELFGHVKGAFTDARNDREGKFEAANNSTLFLDEIGNLPYHLQSKLLGVIQQRKVVRVGSNKPIDINIRLICATNCNIPSMVNCGKFREDLFYRINTITINIPPLRDRKDDIIPMTEMFIKRYCSIYNKPIMELSNKASLKISSYSWPGNIRELQHTIERAVIMGDKILDENAFQFNTINMIDNNKSHTLEDLEKKAIAESINNCDGNLSLVAQQLGITRQTLYNKIKKYNIM
ncbi:MAG: sigma-54 dependent transcriptional regulator [Bacteroidales bacterium]|nr:sigma-54 dependent transcriptional regulator [Bacteroidales bacterium]